MRFAKYGLAAVILLLPLALPLGARAQSLTEARTFVGGLYAAYHGDGPDYLGPQAKRVFSPRLLGLIRHDAARARPGEVGALDGDPICDCQDAGGLTMSGLKVASASPGRAVATVRLHFPDGTRTLRLDLLSVRGAWRVDDIHSQDTPSLARFLQLHAGGR